jgi:hypothetical protein
MQHLVSQHRARLGLEFLALEAFVSEMGAAIPGIVKTARRNVDAEGCEQGLTAAKIDHMLAMTFANRLGYAAIVATYATVEHSLVTLCDLAQQATRQVFSAHDLHGSGLQRFCTYLRRTLGLTPTQNTSWKEMEQIALVRHCIAHMGGHVPSVRNRPRLDAALRTLKVRVGADGYLAVRRPVVGRVVKQARNWVYEVVDEVRVALPSATPNLRPSAHDT